MAARGTGYVYIIPRQVSRESRSSFCGTPEQAGITDEGHLGWKLFWLYIIAVFTLEIILATLFSIRSGIIEIFPYLYILPIILLARMHPCHLLHDRTGLDLPWPRLLPHAVRDQSLCHKHCVVFMSLSRSALSSPRLRNRAGRKSGSGKCLTIHWPGSSRLTKRPTVHPAEYPYSISPRVRAGGAGGTAILIGLEGEQGP